jgi:hypothetical protein
MRWRWKRLLTFAVVVLLTAGSLWFGIVAFDRFLDPFDDQPFSPAAWLNADEHDRGPMARDAIRHLAPGTTAAQVREWLGTPKPVVRDPRGPVDAFGNRLEYPETWTYPLGCWSGLGPYGFDSAYLYVHFGSDGRVAAAEVTGG